jgi:hypothetical protein
LSSGQFGSIKFVFFSTKIKMNQLPAKVINARNGEAACGVLKSKNINHNYLTQERKTLKTR